MTEILGLYPKTGFDIKNASVELPLSLLSTVSTVYQDNDVMILDQRVDEDFDAKLDNALASGPKCVLIPSMTGTQIKYALEISRKVKEMSGARVIWGGVHATLMPMQTIEHKLIDIIV